MITKQEFDTNYQKAYQNDSAAQYTVGKYYLEQKDFWNARSWLTKSADQQNIDAQFTLAELLLTEHPNDANIVKVAELLMKAAIKYEAAKKHLSVGGVVYMALVKMAVVQNKYGYFNQDTKASACYLLGKIHASDIFAAKDMVKAVGHYKQASELGYTQAGNELGDLFYFGKEVEQSYERAFAFFKKTNDRSSSDETSCYFLGWMAEHGQGVAKNLDQAISFYQRPSPTNQRIAVQLGSIYYNKYKAEASWQKERYKEQAINYLKKSGENKESQNYLGVIYFEDKNYPEAASWFEKAAAQSLAVAHHNLASTYKGDKCGKEKTTLVLPSTQKAAELGYAAAQYELAGYYKLGQLGLIKDNVTAFIWMQKAADINYEPAKAELQDQANPLYHYKKLYDAAAKNIEKLKLFVKLEANLGYFFSDPQHLIIALNRAQHPLRHEAEYQRYEFLGDRALNFIMAKYIEARIPKEMSTARAHDIHAKMIENKNILPILAKELNLTALIAVDISEKDHPMTDKMLADVCEALMGAIEKDKGFDAVEAVVLKLWKPHLEKELALLLTEKKVTVALLKPASVAELCAAEPQTKKIKMRDPIAPTVFASKPAAASQSSPPSPRTQRLFVGLTSPEMSMKKLEETVQAAAHSINGQNQGKQGDTPLMLVLRKGADTPKVELLIRYGALWSAPNKAGETAEKLLRQKHSALVQRFLKS